MQQNEKIEQGPISVETICNMLGSALIVPSAAMGQPTQFVVLNDIETLSKAAEIIPGPPIAMQALTAIIVCGDLNKAEIKDKWMIDCESASEQILMTAHASGLGAYRIPIYPDRKRIYGVTVMLSLPDHIVAHSYIAMGYPAKIPGAGEAFCNERVHYNVWVNKNSSS